LDLSKNNIKKSKLLINNSRVQYIQADIITWECDRYFDIITLFDVIEHISKKELKKNLK